MLRLLVAASLRKKTYHFLLTVLYYSFVVHFLVSRSQTSSSFIFGSIFYLSKTNVKINNNNSNKGRKNSQIPLHGIFWHGVCKHIDRYITINKKEMLRKILDTNKTENLFLHQHTNAIITLETQFNQHDDSYIFSFLVLLQYFGGAAKQMKNRENIISFIASSFNTFF